ncbi:MAG: aspartate carbamoyltransferase [Myxococcales bacterium]|nr:aspartate carbamoyltransferase [Myxococcales bacterium]
MNAGGGPLRHLLGLDNVPAETIQLILDQAIHMKDIMSRPFKKVPAMRGTTVVNFFVEPSTRTRISFALAEKHLSADTVSFSPSTSSLSKGETLLDTARNLEAMQPDILVIRHRATGAPHFLARALNCSVVNAGDGIHEHPTQALLDLFTIRESKGRLAGLKVVIAGDIAHSRVARSNIFGMVSCGIDVRVAGPRTMLPQGIENLGVKVFDRLEPAVEGADVVMMLRIQRERLGEALFPSAREYFRFFGLTNDVLSLADKDAIVMHPGPINRCVEIDHDIADGPRSVILDQVTNGIAVRMAVLHLVNQARLEARGVGTGGPTSVEAMEEGT